MVKDFPAEDEPDGDVMYPHHLYTGLILAAFGFMFAWPQYGATGAVMTLLGVLIALDDAISHAFGVWTPLDWGWKQVKQYVP